jgi:hypothetical protein
MPHEFQRARSLILPPCAGEPGRETPDRESGARRGHAADQNPDGEFSGLLVTKGAARAEGLSLVSFMAGRHGSGAFGGSF